MLKSAVSFGDFEAFGARSRDRQLALTIRSERRSASVFFFFPQEKNKLLQRSRPRTRVSFLSLLPRRLLLFFFYSNHCVNTKKETKEKTPLSLSGLEKEEKKKTEVFSFLSLSLPLPLRKERATSSESKLLSIFTSSPRPPCSRRTRPSRPASSRSTPSAARAPP